MPLDPNELYDIAMRVKSHAYPSHTVADPADPVNQLLRSVATLASYAVSEANQALLGVDPSTVQSRGSLLALLRSVGYQLSMAKPSSGMVLIKLRNGADGATVFQADSKLQYVDRGTYSIVSELVAPADGALEYGVVDTSGDYTSSSGSVTLSQGERFVIRSAYGAAFDKLLLTLGTPASGSSFCLETANSEWGTPNGVDVMTPSVTKVYVTDYVNKLSAGTAAAGCEVLVRLRSTKVGEYGTVVVAGDTAYVLVSNLGQSPASAAGYDYEIFAKWLPYASTALDDDYQVDLSMERVFNRGASRWDESELYGRAIAFRLVSGGGSFVVSGAELNGSVYITATAVQGWRRTELLGVADGEPYQRLRLRDAPYTDKFTTDSEFALTVDGVRWEVVADFGTSTSVSTHAVIREDQLGWFVQFGSGTVGAVPSSGSRVQLRYRSVGTGGSVVEEWGALKPAVSNQQVDAVYAPFGVLGGASREVDTAADVLSLRTTIFRAAAVRGDSVISAGDVEAAVTGLGVSSGRATFVASDGTQPFSRCLVDRSGATKYKTYRVVVVGRFDDPAGTVDSRYTDELQYWLNGRTVGLETVGGVGPINSTATCVGFTPVPITPTVVIDSKMAVADVQRAAYAILRSLIKPHAKNSSGDFIWPWVGGVNVATIYYAMVTGLGGLVNTSARVPLSIELSDGTTTWGPGDTIELEPGSLPVLDSAFVSTAITVKRS